MTVGAHALALQELGDDVEPRAVVRDEARDGRCLHSPHVIEVKPSRPARPPAVPAPLAELETVDEVLMIHSALP